MSQFTLVQNNGRLARKAVVYGGSGGRRRVLGSTKTRPVKAPRVKKERVSKAQRALDLKALNFHRDRIVFHAKRRKEAEMQEKTVEAIRKANTLQNDLARWLAINLPPEPPTVPIPRPPRGTPPSTTPGARAREAAARAKARERLALSHPNRAGNRSLSLTPDRSLPLTLDRTTSSEPRSGTHRTPDELVREWSWNQPSTPSARATPTPSPLSTAAGVHTLPAGIASAGSDSTGRRRSLADMMFRRRGGKTPTSVVSEPITPTRRAWGSASPDDSVLRMERLVTPEPSEVEPLLESDMIVAPPRRGERFRREPRRYPSPPKKQDGKGFFHPIFAAGSGFFKRPGKNVGAGGAALGEASVRAYMARRRIASGGAQAGRMRSVSRANTFWSNRKRAIGAFERARIAA